MFDDQAKPNHEILGIEETDLRLATLVRLLKTNANPFLDSDQILSFTLSLNGFGLNLLCGRCRDPEIKTRIVNLVFQAVVSRNDGEHIIALLGNVLRGESFATSWLNTEKQLFRHRILDCFEQLLLAEPGRVVRPAVFCQLFRTVMTAAPTVPVDTRGQCADIISKFFEILSQDLIEVHLGDMERTLKCFSPSPERPHCLQAVKPHDTIDPHINFPDQPVLDSLLQASVRKAGERAFVFVLRLLRNLLANKPDCEKSVAPLLKGAEHKEKVLSDLKKGVLSSPEFERFIQQRLPSRCSSLEDYVINRHQVLLYDLTIHDLCRLIIACPENASSSIAARATTTAFFRQVFAIGYACNIGLEARPFFIDHGFGPTGEQLDWPSYVFIPAGAIWGKGAGVDVSCGVAFGGGVDLSERKGRDGAYIGGSWSSTLYHGHSHVGGNRASAGAESRERILHFGLTVEDGRRLPWGRYIEAEEQLRGDMYEGVRTYLLTPKGRGQERLSSV